jgi:hypothetical protein
MKTPGCISSEGAGRLILRTTHIHLISTQPVQGKTPADRLSRYPISVDEWCLTIGIGKKNLAKASSADLRYKVRAGGAYIAGGGTDIVCLELHYKFTGGAYIVLYVCDKRRRLATAAASIQRTWSIANRERSSR